MTDLASQPTAIDLADDRVLQYLSEIVGGVDEYFICRKKECLFFTLNVNWVHMEERYREREREIANQPASHGQQERERERERK